MIENRSNKESVIVGFISSSHHQNFAVVRGLEIGIFKSNIVHDAPSTENHVISHNSVLFLNYKIKNDANVKSYIPGEQEFSLFD